MLSQFSCVDVENLYSTATFVLRSARRALIHCPDTRMIANYVTKPLVGSRSREFRKLIMNLKNEHPDQDSRSVLNNNLNPQILLKLN